VQAHTWWIDEPFVIGASNPSDQDRDQLLADGFGMIFSFLEEEKQPPKYNKQSAVAAGLTVYSFPIAEGGVASLDQLSEFMQRVKAAQRNAGSHAL
jgi:protein tyrosine phosphatase (PTP) superfamily phosphohydrolase (DUF442 family)